MYKNSGINGGFLSGVPKHPLFRYNDPDNSGFRTILWEEGVAAFHTAGHYFKKYIRGDAPVTVDSITYFAVLASLMRVGFIPFPISIRNPVPAIVHLMKSTGVRHLIDRLVFLVLSISPTIMHCGMPRDRVRASQFNLGPASTFHRLWRNGHLRGSVWITGNADVPLDGFLFTLLFCALFELQPFRAADFFRQTSTCAIIASFPPVEPPLIPTAERFLSSIINTKTTIVVTVPSFLVMYGGGPLEKDAGDTLVAKCIFVISPNVESPQSCLSQLLPESIPMGGWEWITAGSNVDVVPTDEKDIYRLHKCVMVGRKVVITRLLSSTLKSTECGPSTRRTWCNYILQIGNCSRFVGVLFTDDQIMHSTGTNPGPIEAGLAADNRVAAALMFGRSKFQPGILILPAPEEAFDPSDTTRLLEYRTKIWLVIVFVPLGTAEFEVTRDTIMKVNEQAPQLSRIYKEMILIAKPPKPFEFTAKGTLRRKAILKAYDQEIEDLYKAVDDVSHSDVVIPQLWSLRNVMTMIRDIVTAVLEREIGDSDDIFAAGVRAEQFTKGDEAGEAVYSEINYVSDRNIIKLRDGTGEPPLVVIHSAVGFYFTYASYADKFRTAVWALTIVPGTPLNSLSELASFYFAQIKAERPHGPYRFVPYSSSSFLLVALVKLFGDNGDEVAQAVMLDHFPALFVYSANRLGNPDPRVPENIRNMLDMNMDTIAGLMDRDSNRDALQRTKSLLLDGWKGVYANDTIRDAIRNTKGFRTANAEFVYDLTTDETGLSSIELMAQWMRTVKVPITVVVAPEGALGAISEEDRKMWADLGTK
ncbi:NRPS-like enzyme [Armillaria nabsnona]|nr:NRPS-like enzyme [Armillaria nabsnona]